MIDSELKERLEDLIDKSRKMRIVELRSGSYGWHKHPEPAEFTAWRTQSLACLRAYDCIESTYVRSFDSATTHCSTHFLETGTAILSRVLEDLMHGHLIATPTPSSPILILETLFNRFHLVARQMRYRHDSRPTLDVRDEYDVQDLCHSMLCIHFDDIRPEEWTPSYAGKSSRMDFFLKMEGVVVETKMARRSMSRHDISTQLIEDVQRYQAHPGCLTLACFVYDPEGILPNPRGLESDLSRDDGPFPVRVFVRPK